MSFNHKVHQSNNLIGTDFQVFDIKIFTFQKMPSHLPQELLDKIAFYLPYEKGISISKYLEKRLGRAPIDHSWKVKEQGNFLGSVGYIIMG
jgi:hypothetical protein